MLRSPIYILRTILRLSILILGISVNCNAQLPSYNITYRLLTQDDGLASRSVNTGIIDSRGFIWLGAKDGLNCYDGDKFHLFTKEKQGLQENNIDQLAEDDQRKLWVLYGRQGINNVSSGKLDILDIGTKQIVPFHKYFKQNLPFKQEQILGITASKAHELYIFCNDHNVYLYAHGTVKRLNKDTLAGIGTHFSFFTHATDKGVWLKYDCFIDRSGKVTIMPKYQEDYQVMAFEGEDAMMLMSLNKVFHYNFPTKYNMLRWESARIVQASPNGLRDYRGDVSEYVKQKLHKICEQDYYLVLRDPATGNSVIINEERELLLYKHKEKELITLLDTNRTKNLPKFSIRQVFSDNENKLWVCTSIGAFVFKIGRNYFTRYLNIADYKLSGEISNNQFRGIYADTVGNIYVGGSTGAYHIYDSKRDKPEVDKINSNAYTGPVISSGDSVYFGAYDFTAYDVRTKHHGKLFDIKWPNSIWSIHKLESNRWWLSNQSDFYLYANKTLHPIRNAKGDTLKKVWVHQYYKANDGKLWIVSSKGLFQMLNDSTTSLHWGVDEDMPACRLPFEDIHSIVQDAEGNYWMATNGDGLYERTTNNRFRHFTIADGLSSNVLYGILQDAKGFLWISSDNGLMRFNTHDYTIKTYSTKEGITTNEFNRLSYYKAADGRMYFGGLDGINAFYPSDFWNDNRQFAAPIRVTFFNQFSAQSNKLEDRTAELYLKKKIKLLPGDNFFTLEFALLDFENSKHRYAYKIEGIDKAWNYIDENTIRISHLPYGEYVLKVKGQNSEGEWSSGQLSIPVQVVAPFYMHTWFIVLCIVVIILLIIGYTRFRVWQYKKQNATLEKIIDSRTNELKLSLQQKEVLLKEIHHRVKNNLQVISSLLQLQSRNVNDKAAKEALIESNNRVLSIALVHQKLYQNEQLDTVDLSTLAEELFYQISGIFSDNRDWVTLNNQLPQLLMNVDVAVPLGLILNELMTNSFKYAFNSLDKPMVSLSMTIRDENILLKYTDNGPGLPKDFNLLQTKSLGTRLVVRLTKQLNSTVEYYDDGGVNYIFAIPSSLITPNIR